MKHFAECPAACHGESLCVFDSPRGERLEEVQACFIVSKFEMVGLVTRIFIAKRGMKGYYYGTIKTIRGE